MGELAFVRDADGGDALVGLASLVGKWVRDLMMMRINRHYEGTRTSGDRFASGYHDPVTASFVERTQALRDARGLPNDCFEREKAAPPATRRTRLATV